jgi:hypothetical protein
LLGLCPAANADLLTFASGGTVELPAEIEGDTVRLLAPGRTYSFLRSDFVSILPRLSTQQEWVRRERRAQGGDASERLTAARWAWTHGLTREAEALLRETDRLRPADMRVARLVRCLDALKTQWRLPDPAAMTGDLGGKFSVTEGPHVVLLHQHSEREAAERVELLEQVITSFFLDFEDLGISLDPPRMRLVSVWFSERPSYLAYLERQGATVFRSTRGYHHPTRGIVVTYDARSDSEQALAREAIEREEARLQTMTATDLLADSSAGRKAREVQRQRLLLELRSSELDLGTAAHETIHQLVAQTHLAPSYAAFPVWLHEGLAMQYEPVVGGRWAGPAPACALRLRDYRAMAKPPRLSELLEDRGLGRGYRRDPYAAAWAWVHFLRAERPDVWLTMLDRLRTQNGGAGSPCERATSVLASIDPTPPGGWERLWHTRTAALEVPGRPTSSASRENAQGSFGPAR